MPDRLTDEQLDDLRLEANDCFGHRGAKFVNGLLDELLELREENERLKQELRIALDDDEEMYHAILDRTQGDL